MADAAKPSPDILASGTRDIDWLGVPRYAVDASKHEPYASGRQPPAQRLRPRRRRGLATVEPLHEGKRAVRRVAVHLALDGHDGLALQVKIRPEIS